MFITTQNEIISLMPTARWDRPAQLFGYLEEEERVALEPLLGTALYQHLLGECVRLRETYVDITSSTVRPTGDARHEPELPYADVTARLDAIQGRRDMACHCRRGGGDEEWDEVPEEDMAAIRLIRICQQIEFYRMLAHKAGLLTVSFNEGGGMNTVSADGYEPADEKRMERVVKDAFMSAGRATDSLLLFLEADAKGDRRFTGLWQEADTFYLHKDLLFQTARVLNEYLDIKGERMAYVALVRDIRFCQMTYLKPRVGARLLKAVVAYANDGAQSDSSDADEVREEAYGELLSMLRTALAFYVESRRAAISNISLLSGSGNRSVSAAYQKDERLARRDSMTDAQQALALACQFIGENLDAFGDDAVGTPVYNAVREREAQQERDRACACAAAERQRREVLVQRSRKLYTGFPATHRTPERKTP
ncbi:MAG: hypothetical protein IKH15_11765 [Bacteroidales bacterium]|nr:hypothetical protein [Bacteroidales bacterium]